MANFIKHRRESIDLSVGFSDVLDANDSLSSVSSVTITRFGRKADKSSEFGSPSGSISGTDVNVTLSASTGADTQREDTYQLLVEVATSGGDTHVASDRDGRLPTILVVDDGDPNA